MSAPAILPLSAACGACLGSGVVWDDRTHVCPECEGTGREIVSCEVCGTAAAVGYVVGEAYCSELCRAEIERTL